MNRISCSLLAVALLRLPVALTAQTTPEIEKKEPKTPTPSEVANSASDSETKTDTVELERFETTGSRLRMTAGESPAIPVVTLTHIDLERRGVNSLEDLRWAIPQLGASRQVNDNFSNGGPSHAQQTSTSFNLRGLGGNSTLVLVDGRRIARTGQEAPGGAGGREDYSLDGIPVAAIDHIDVLPSGAGAIYGADALGGVINVVLKKNYKGAELRVSYDNTFDSDAGLFTVALTAGYHVGKLSTFLSLSYAKQNGMNGTDRWFARTFDTTAFGPSGTNSTFFSGASGSGALSSTAFPSTGGAALPGLTTHVVGIPAGSKGSGLTAADYAAAPAPGYYDSAPYSSLLEPQRRTSLIFKADYDAAKWLKPYGELRLNQFFDTYTAVPITMNVSLPVGYPGNPFSTPVVLRKTFFDLPRGVDKAGQSNPAANLGVKGDLPGDWRYDLNTSWARNVVTDSYSGIGGAFNFNLLSAAIANPDPTKRPILAYDSTVPGNNPNAPGALVALAPFFNHRDVSDVFVNSVYADGTVWTGWAGEIKLAVGGETQQEKIRFHRDPGDPALAYTLTKPFSRDSNAVFAETNIPLLSSRQNIPFVERLEAGAAIRYDHIGGGVGSARTPQYTGLFQPVKWLTFRASRSEGFKSAKLQELLAPVFVGVTTITASRGIFDPLRNNEPVVGTLNLTSGGNPLLHPEHSVSKNYGFVFEVPGIKGLSFSADHQKIDYVDKIGTPPTQVLITLFPERVTRRPASDGLPGVIAGLDTTNMNLARYYVSHWDLSVNYQHSFSFGSLDFAASSANPQDIVSISVPGGAPSRTLSPRRGTASVFWSRGPWTLGTSYNYQSAYPRSSSLGSPVYTSVEEWNPRVAYNFKKSSAFATKEGVWWRQALAGTQVSVTLINAFNREPSLGDAAGSLYLMDPRLRRYVVTLVKEF